MNPPLPTARMLLDEGDDLGGRLSAHVHDWEPRYAFVNMRDRRGRMVPRLDRGQARRLAAALLEWAGTGDEEQVP